MISIIQRFVRNRCGGVAITFGISLLPLALATGAAVDYSRLSAARTAAQAAADTGALAVAAARSGKDSELRQIAERFVEANLIGTLASSAKMTEFSYRSGDKSVEVTVEGALETTVMAVAGIQTMSYKAVSKAVRATPGTTEVALVLDNTYSMVGDKLTSLKSASIDLVETLKEDTNADVKIAVVPYGDYVNVGVQNRSEKWVSVPSDYNESSVKVCKTLNKKNVCQKSGPAQYCTRYVDNVPETYDCTPSTCKEVEVGPYESCSGGGTKKFTWFGCVASRTKGTLRQSDAEPTTTYPGLLATSQNCLNPIVPLTSSKSKVTAALSGMIVNIGGYKPQTYIPAGLIWGVNVLSPSEPFNEAAAYDSNNRKPRKVMVLMTDGENTLRFDSNSGKHVGLSSNPGTAATQVSQTYADMQAICDYAKSKRIEVFTVAFGEMAQKAKSAMGSCATSSAHSFDAKSKSELVAAFQNIARSLTTVRITN